MNETLLPLHHEVVSSDLAERAFLCVQQLLLCTQHTVLAKQPMKSQHQYARPLRYVHAPMHGQRLHLLHPTQCGHT